MTNAVKRHWPEYLMEACGLSLRSSRSGMSLNPARSFASAMLAQLWTGFWIYLTAPLLGMLLAAEVHHANDRRCIFRCRYARNPS